MNGGSVGISLLRASGGRRCLSCGAGRVVCRVEGELFRGRGDGAQVGGVREQGVRHERGRSRWNERDEGRKKKRRRSVSS